MSRTERVLRVVVISAVKGWFFGRGFIFDARRWIGGAR